MTWLQRYTLWHYLRNSVWILPVFGMVAALVSVNGLKPRHNDRTHVLLSLVASNVSSIIMPGSVFPAPRIKPDLARRTLEAQRLVTSNQ